MGILSPLNGRSPFEKSRTWVKPRKWTSIEISQTFETEVVGKFFSNTLTYKYDLNMTIFMIEIIFTSPGSICLKSRSATKYGIPS